MRILSLFLWILNPFIFGFTLPGLAQDRYIINQSAFTGDPPQLLEAHATFNYVRSELARYYFTFNLPENADQSLEKVTLQGIESPEYINFEVQQTRAFIGTQDNSGQELVLKEVLEDKSNKTFSLTFEPPIPPGTIFTVSLKPRQNPAWSGFYLIKIMAFPVGQGATGLNLGTVQLHLAAPRW